MRQSPVAIIGLTQLLREGLQTLLRRSRFIVTVNAENLAAAIPDLETKRPELAVCVISTSESVADWIDCIRRSRAELGDVRIVFLTDQLTAETVRHAAAASVCAILSSNITGDVFQRSLELVMLGQQVFPCFPEETPARPLAALIPFNRHVLTTPLYNEPSIVTKPAAINAPFSSSTKESVGQRSTALSERERQILRCLVEGAANKTIARDLLITEATVKVHIKGLLRKIGVSNRTQAAVWGLNNRGLLGSPTPTVHENNRAVLADRQVAS